MKKFKRILASLLVLCLMVGLVPASAMPVEAATGNVMDAAIFCSDVHGSSSAVSSAFNGIKNSDSTFEPSTASFVGDTQMAASSVTSAAKSVYSELECIYAYGNHDSEGNYGIEDTTGLVYGDSSTNYYIYAISQTSMASANPSTTDFTNTIATLDKSKPLFILSHLPLHDRRGDNNGAAVWYPVIETAAEQMDIVFFWGHNHTGEESEDQKAFYVAKDGTETMTLEDTNTEVTPNFTYMNAGYVGKNSSRGGVVSTVKIYGDSLVFQDYTSSGEFTGTYAHNVEVAREFAQEAKTLSSISVTTQPTKTEYNVGDTFDKTGMVVTATYSDGTTTNVTAEAVVSTVDMSTAGTKTVTVTYEGKTATFDITVKAVDSGDEEEPDVPADGMLPTTATVTGVTTTEKKDVYVLVNTPTAGKQYIIASTGSAGDAYALKENTITGSSITINAASGNITAPYIATTDETIMWNAASGMTFQSENGGYNLRYNNDLSFSTSRSTNWTVGTNSAYVFNNSRYRYLYNDNGTWKTSSSRSTSSSYKVYFYEKQTVEISTSANGTYSIEGTPAEVSKVVVAGTTATLGSTLTFKPSDSSDVTTTDTSETATYTIYKDEAGIISEINGNTVTFTGNYGTAYVKVSYTVTVNGKDYPVDNYITVEAKEPTYAVDITKGGKSVEEILTVKGVANGQTLQLGQNVTCETAEGTQTVNPTEGTIEWEIPKEYQSIATIDEATGLVTFKGVTGSFTVTVSYEENEGHSVTDTITISANTSAYTTPSDGTNDFPEYPNEGSIRYDKTAEAVGNFSETGIVKMELSMTGVPYTTGSEIDVVLMLDMTGSMDDVTSSTRKPTGYTRVDATIAAAKAFVKSIVINEDGSYNKNRVGIYVFNKNGAATLYDFGVIDTDAKLESIIGKVGNSGVEFGSDYTKGDLDTIYDDHYASGGTPYDDGLSKCQEVLAAAKTDGIGNERQQFTVFMTDGVPTSYEYVNGTSHANHSSASSIAGMLTSASNYATRDTDYKYEYYSTEMKKAGVTVYTVGVGLYNENNAWSGTATQCGNLASALLNDISGPAGETTQPDAVGTSTTSKKEEYFFSVDDATAGTDMKNVFKNIAQKILQAATDVKVEDKITDEYTMIFDMPKGSKEITGVTNDFYIEFLEYELDEETHERGTSTSKSKLYLKNNNGMISAASNSTGTAYAAPVFEAKTLGEKGTVYYWTTVSSASDSGVSYTANGTTYYFVPNGMKATDEGFDSSKWFNMTSGGYATGTVDSATNMSDNLVIATPYYVYNANTKMLYWTVDKLGTTEYALNYFLYLDNSATEVGTSKEVDAKTYPTNKYANITYTNFRGNDCQQTFPVPQMTWNGAQVSYVFYLVNAAGQPINKAGQVVDFANATFITDVYTKSVVWNKNADGTVDGTSNLSQEWLAKELLPENYKVYDELAGYDLYVYASHTGENLFDYFTIKGGTADVISSSLNTRLELNTVASTVSTETTKVYNTKAGVKYSTHGTYTSDETDRFENETVLNTSFDFANTTVAFAVVWQPTLVEDTVVVDYGLPVVIDVVQNDMMQNVVSGIGLSNTAYGNTAMNNGVSTTSKLGIAALKTNAGSTISIENEKAIRYTQNDMEFTEPDVFYYESPVEFYEGSEKKEGHMYSSVTVIPATTIYYEDSFVTFTSFTKDEATGTYNEDLTSKWENAGNVNTSATQDQDRPGKSQISGTIDADNVYGYDNAYKTSSEYSLGSSKAITIDSSVRGEATFEFYGTGFDIIGLTSNKTGTLIVQVMDSDGNSVKTSIVDTYYGYAYVDGEWVTVDSNSPNALYQIPVMKIFDLEYGKYTVKLTAGYNSGFDHTGDGEYTLYIDAIRIYDPANDGATDDVIKDAYKSDGEAYPEYTELRNEIITADTFNTLDGNTIVSGIVFIDGAATDPDEKVSIADYTSYGPNNELYLQSGQAVAFDLYAGRYTTEVWDDSKVAKVQLAVKSVGGTGAVEVYGIDENGIKIECLDETISTATDMYYDITVLNGMTVVIKNSGSNDDATISLTNIKTTYTEAQTVEDGDIEGYSLLSVRRTTGEAAMMSLRSVDDGTTDDGTTDDGTTDDGTTDDGTTDDGTTDDGTTDDGTSDDNNTTGRPVINTIINVVKSVISWLSRWFR